MATEIILITGGIFESPALIADPHNLIKTTLNKKGLKSIISKEKHKRN